MLVAKQRRQEEVTVWIGGRPVSQMGTPSRKKRSREQRQYTVSSELVEWMGY